MEKMFTPVEEQKPENEAPEAQTTPQIEQAGGRKIKQASFAIGNPREVKLDELALAYNKQKGTRIGRNDIIRYLIDTTTIDQLLSIDLTEYKK